MSDSAEDRSVGEPAKKKSRRIRRERAPSYPMRSHGQRGRIFVAEDVPGLAAVAGLPLIAAANPDGVANELDFAIGLALSWEGTAARTPPEQKVLDFLATVEASARDLLEVLDEPADGRECEGRAAGTSDWYLHVTAGLHGPTPPRFWLTMSDPDARDFCGRLALRHLEARQEFFEAMNLGEGGRQAAYYRAGSEPLLKAAPTMLRTLAAAARNSRLEKENAPSRSDARNPGGRRRKPINHTLFRDLDRLHRSAFGCAPVIKGKVSRRYGPGVDWALAVLRLAQSRLPTVLIKPDSIDLTVIADAAALSDDRIAVLLIKAADVMEKSKTAAQETQT